MKSKTSFGKLPVSLCKTKKSEGFRCSSAFFKNAEGFKEAFLQNPKVF
jgi:hypothetical protein